jgi:CubicO group peptidase (beta-lactamase class C family)
MLRFALSALLATGLAAPAFAGEEAPTARVDALFSAWNKPGSPGCAIGVMKQGALIHARGYGMAADGAPLTADSVLNVGSMAKQFTAASVGLLVLDGKLSVAQDVRTSFPERQLAKEPISVDRLVHHESGLRDYTVLASLRGETDLDNARVLDLLARQKALNFPPGDRFLYSNSNYVVLAELVQRASKSSLPQFAARRLFAPLGMKSTRFDEKGGSVGDGGLYTTVNDLARWDENFYTGKIGGPKLVELMRTRGVLANGQPVPYGFGLQFGEYRGLAMESHAGTFKEFRAELMRFPAQHFSVAVLCNTGSANATALATQVADIYLADVLQPRAPAGARPAEVRIDPAAFDRLAGDYAIDNAGQRAVMRFSRNGERFFAQALGQPPVEVFASSETELFAKVVDTRMTFHPDADGHVQRVTIHRARGDLGGVRVAAPPAPAGGELTQLAGRYRSDELDAELRLQVEDGRLFAYDAHNRRIPLQLTAEDRFDLPGDGTFAFRRSADRKAEGFTYSSTRVLNLWFSRAEP